MQQYVEAVLKSKDLALTEEELKMLTKRWQRQLSQSSNGSRWNQIVVCRISKVEHANETQS